MMTQPAPKMIAKGIALGQRFGDLYVIGKSDQRNPSNGAYLITCECACGQRKDVDAKSLRRTGHAHCPCHPTPPPISAGDQFGRLTVLGRDSVKDASGCFKWRCQCRCGGEGSFSASALRAGNVRSCGCLRRETWQAMQDAHWRNFDFNRQYGLLQPLSPLSPDRYGHRRILARCLGCGGRKAYLATNVRNGFSRTCGKSRCIALFHQHFPDAPPHPKSIK